MKIRVFIFLVLLSGAACSPVVTVHRGAGSIIRTMEVAEISGPRLYEMSRVWLSRNLYSEKDIFSYENPAEETLVANGVVEYPATGQLAVEIPKFFLLWSFLNKLMQ